MSQKLEIGLNPTRDNQDKDLEYIEIPENIQLFSNEAREQLTKEKYIIYSLTGQSIKTLRNSNHPFWSTWHKDYPDFEALQSRLSEVAINPKQLFLPESSYKTLTQQLEMVTHLSEAVSQKMPGVTAIIGEIPDYVELAFAHLKTTGQYLFGSDYSYDYTRTVTRVGPYVARVGAFRANVGLDIVFWLPDSRYSRLWAAPLIVPSGK